jgi:hypothetical protein
MPEISKSFRLEEGIAAEVTRRAEASGTNFSSFVAELVTRALEEPKPSEGAHADGDLGVLRRDIVSLREALRAERLGHSEIADTILGLSRVAKEFETERQSLALAIAKSTVEMDRVKDEMKHMAEVGGLASRSVGTSSSSLVKALTQADAASKATLLSTEQNLRRMEAASESLSKLAAWQETSFKETAKEFAQMVKLDARDFLADVGRKWRLVLTAVAITFIMGAGASAFWIFFNQSQKVARAELELKKAQSLVDDRNREVSFLLRGACEGRRVSVDKRYCPIYGSPPPLNPYQ